MNNQKLVDLFWRRDEDAIVQTQAAYGSSLLRLAQRITGDMGDAQECVNDTYHVVWNTIPPERPLHFFAYLAKICRNFAFAVLDKRGAEKRSATVVELTQELQQCIPDRMAEARLENLELGETLDRFLGILKPEERCIFLRRYWYGDSVREIADYYSVSQSKVKTQLHRTRQKLKGYLEKEGIRL